jgi:hypothetical protein
LIKTEISLDKVEEKVREIKVANVELTRTFKAMLIKWIDIEDLVSTA